MAERAAEQCWVIIGNTGGNANAIAPHDQAAADRWMYKIASPEDASHEGSTNTMTTLPMSSWPGRELTAIECKASSAPEK